ncbi:transcriptional regulator, AbrB family [Candidatus Moduliflexus flocculans]|uniref:Transcriptional regulator, AbrB family n=1 Tax=Candidatus Moduliflexus flocculans TaxID=1499966 RepID=A0A081BRT2_9BACT|nr:transcriptional regulator, AbrB family [Candidatus Moduliflexus flocculans]
MHMTVDGQIVLPRNVQEKLRMTPDAEVEFIEENERFYLVNRSTVSQQSYRFRKLRGIATVKMPTDEIMSLTRGES